MRVINRKIAILGIILLIVGVLIIEVGIIWNVQIDPLSKPGSWKTIALMIIGFDLFVPGLILFGKEIMP